jgi:hypothetical protein
LLLIPFFVFAQDPFCLELTNIIKIESTSDIPIISDNGDGTITLTHPDEQYITDIFASYTLYGFYQANPSSSNPETLKYYFIEHNSKNLFSDVNELVPETIYTVDNYIPDYEMSQSLITLLDGNTYRFSGVKYFSPGDMSGNCFFSSNCIFDSLPEDFSMEILFSYNNNDDSFRLETPTPTSCGNVFEISIKPNYNSQPSFSELQTWEISPDSSGEFVENCSETESWFYGPFGLNCSDFYDEQIRYNIISNDGIIRFQIFDVFGGQTLLEFRDINLGIDDSFLSKISLYQIKNSEFITITNPNQLNVSGQIYSTSGKRILSNTRFNNNTLGIDILEKNVIYFVILTIDNQSKMVKFIKR